MAEHVWVVAELAESSEAALELLAALDVREWPAEDVRTLDRIVGRLTRAVRAYRS